MMSDKIANKVSSQHEEKYTSKLARETGNQRAKLAGWLVGKQRFNRIDRHDGRQTGREARKATRQESKKAES
ncbi:Protein of unknown function [Gryllus bimaculatus]|nr:Protein of unknown function [Gryllus bimaculatus]